MSFAKAVVSELNAASVKHANCAKQDNGWIITIHLKDEPFDTNELRKNALSPESLMEGGRAKLADDMIRKSAYSSCMGVDFVNALQYTDQGSSGLPSNAASNAPSVATVGSIEGAFKNGAIVAVLDQAGLLTSLTLSHVDYMGVGVRGTKIKISSTSKQEYQLTW